MPRTIFITDAASPLGRACAVRLGRAGWNVIMGGAVQTVARQASKVIVDALEQDWEKDPIRISLVEPHGLDGPKQMARPIARTLNGAPPRRPIQREQRLIAS